MMSPIDAMTHDEWIERYVSAQPGRFVRGKCDAATRAMVAVFPELRRACGFAHSAWGADQHWWCVAFDGWIVDPTASQFPSAVDYEEIDPATDRDRVPTGVCMNCGDHVFLHATFCGESCRAAAAELMAAR